MYLFISALCLLLLNQYTLCDILKTCEICKCSKLTYNVTIVNCANLNIPNIQQYWPESEKHLIISFANNKIQHLKQIPITQSDTISLSLKNCSIEKVDANLFLQAINIEYVDLSHNLLKFEDLSGNIFRGPYNNESYEPISLREINLSYNQINNLDRYLFQHSPNLTYLDMSGNPIQIFTSDMWFTIEYLKNLQTLILSNTSLQEVSKDIITKTGAISVKKLDISHNELNILPEYFGALFPAIEILTINNNPIQELTNKSFIGYKQLRILHISYMSRLRSIRHNTFSNLTQLRTLYLNHNHQLSHINEFAFGKNYTRQPPLVELHINDNNLLELNSQLLNWNTLTTLETNGNHWICNCNDRPSIHCDCEKLKRRAISLTNIEFKPDSHPKRWTPIRITLTVISIILCCMAIAFVWFIFVKYRRLRIVNVQYPVIYTNVPTGI